MLLYCPEQSFGACSFQRRQHFEREMTLGVVLMQNVGDVHRRFLLLCSLLFSHTPDCGQEPDARRVLSVNGRNLKPLCVVAMRHYSCKVTKKWLTIPFFTYLLMLGVR